MKPSPTKTDSLGCILLSIIVGVLWHRGFHATAIGLLAYLVIISIAWLDAGLTELLKRTEGKHEVDSSEVDH